MVENCPLRRPFWCGVRLSGEQHCLRHMTATFPVGVVAKASFGCPNLPNDVRDTFPRSFVKTPERTTAAAFPRYLNGEILADSESLGWPGLYVRRWRFSRVVDRLLVPATAEPHISCNIAGSAEFLERDPGGNWITRQIRPGDSFVTRSRTPYEVSFRSPPGINSFQRRPERLNRYVHGDAFELFAGPTDYLIL